MSKTITLGSLIDAIMVVEAELNAHAKVVKDLETKRSAMIQNLEDMMLAANTDTAGGKLGKAKTEVMTVPTPSDWNAIYAYVTRNKAWDLMYRRINPKAWSDRLADGKVVPGIEATKIRKTKVTPL